MYTVTVTRDLIAQHFLTVPNPGPEGELHSHHFGVELTLRGPELDRYRYLTDIDAVNAMLDEVEARYADETLNDLPEFEGGNPSVERFARVVWERVAEALDPDYVEALEVRIWEDETACAGYEQSV
ncbi:6-pyruvoyl tetrahydropterin synthase family protein [Halomarina halobia]|uniref:6-pyruvoyl tetrahydropterin synthase family protein n=1 Tax=Halomarina halobia TaxID=3033386 RepID=A0ABD6A5C5_9EURY|nr:6-carboxytetrahydropterin synthase [Halomarina sp. PSR21]